ncbi:MULTISPECIES: TenA family protein [unclassified Legionella]|uniref:TenA family protein n=2 Tax=Legionella TaxID=445 RepID=UPI003AF67DB8
MVFSRIMHRCSTVFPKIYHHPFNQKLYEGSLPRTTFRLYLEQDELYLRELSYALGLTSLRCSNQVYAKQLRGVSAYIKETERKFHLKYLAESPTVTFFNHKAIGKKIPVIASYTDYLLDNAKHAPIEVAVASFLPCFMIYRELGKRMDLTTCALDHPYRRWMASYSSENFISATKTITQITQELTEPIMCPLQQERVVSSFTQSAEFEWQFFEAVFTGEKGYTVVHDNNSIGRF